MDLNLFIIFKGMNDRKTKQNDKMPGCAQYLLQMNSLFINQWNLFLISFGIGLSDQSRITPPATDV